MVGTMEKTAIDEESLLLNTVQQHPINPSLALRFFQLAKDAQKNIKYKHGKPKIVGKQLGFRIQAKDLNSPTFLEWIEAQSNFSDSIRYLIEQEIILNGVRNLGKYIPQDRDLEEALQEHRRVEGMLERRTMTTETFEKAPVSVPLTANSPESTVTEESIETTEKVARPIDIPKEEVNEAPSVAASTSLNESKVDDEDDSYMAGW